MVGDQSIRSEGLCVRSKGHTQRRNATGENWIFPFAGGKLFCFFFLIYRQQQGWHSDVMNGENHGQSRESCCLSTATGVRNDSVIILCASDKKLMWPAQLIDQVIK